MKLSSFCLISHSAVAGLAVLIAGFATLAGGVGGLMIGGAAAVMAGIALGVLCAKRIQTAVQELTDNVSAKGWETRGQTGFYELDELADFLSDHVRKVTTSSTRAQGQVQELQKLLAQIDRRGKVNPEHDLSPAFRLRDLLHGMIGSADSDLKQALTLMQEIEQSTRAMSSGASDQSEAVSKTTTYVEQMSANIDLVSQNADGASQAAEAVRESAGEALELVRELISGMEHIRRHVEAGWRKLRSLGDRTQEIGSIVETIAGIAARTDMLALNASIESVRAGEHGRGFAVVADEVRKLAEQAAQSTKEVAGLIESVQSETQESISVMAQEHAQVEAEVGRVKSAGTSLEQISKTSSESAERVGEITKAAANQLRFTQEVVLAMERISEVAKGIRGKSEGVSWTTKSLSNLVRQLDASFSPLRGCYDDDATEQPTAANDQTDQAEKYDQADLDLYDASPETVLRQTEELRDAARDAAAELASVADEQEATV